MRSQPCRRRATWRTSSHFATGEPLESRRRRYGPSVSREAARQSGLSSFQLVREASALGSDADLHALLRVDRAELLDDLELAVNRLGDVHVHPQVMLTGDH